MTDDFHQRFHAMSESIFNGSPAEAQEARAFYRTIVGSDARVRLTVALRLKLTDGGQDWEIEVADAQRIAEFLDCYETRPLDEEERHWLLELIVASLDDHLTINGRDERIEARVRRHLIEALDAHRGSIEYWACLKEPEAARFAVTPMMREILQVDADS